MPTSTAAYFENLRTIAPFSSELLPPVWPHSMSFASTRPAEAAAFVHEYMGGTIIDQELPAECNATVQIGLAEFVGAEPYPFYVQFLHHPQARAGYFPLRGIEAYLERLHGNLTEDHYDQYMDDHLGMEAVVRGDDSSRSTTCGRARACRGSTAWPRGTASTRSSCRPAASSSR